MIVILCTVAVALGGAVMAAHKVATSPKSQRVVWQPRDKSMFVKEQALLSQVLVKELDRIIASENKNFADLKLVIDTLKTIVRTAWVTRTYYDPITVSPFLKVLEVSGSLECERMSSQYLELLQKVIQEIVPDCSEALIREENGSTVTDFTYKAMRRMETQTVLIEKHTRNKSLFKKD